MKFTQMLQCFILAYLIAALGILGGTLIYSRVSGKAIRITIQEVE
jgi:hypothetical protein